MAVPRERTQIATRNGGTCGRFTWYPDYGPGVEVNAALNFARDSVGWEDDYPLDFDRSEYSGGTMNQAYGGYFSSWFHNWCPEILRSGFNLSHLSTPSDADVDPYYATQAVARSNPSAPIVDLPVEIGQLHELAGLMHPGRGGPSIVAPLRELGNQYLATSFGAVPVANAAKQLLQSHSAIDRRIQVIERLQAKEYRRTMQMDVSTAQSTEYWYIDTAHSTAGGDFEISTVAGVRAHVRWGLYPGAFAGNKTPSQMRAAIADAASRAVSGQTIDLSTFWQVTPFTWLLDWFLGIGDYLKATRNTGIALLKEVVVMRHRLTQATYPGIVYEPGGGAKTMHIAPIRMRRESKSRRFSFPSPLTAHLPLLDRGTCTTLASLAATR